MGSALRQLAFLLLHRAAGGADAHFLKRAVVSETPVPHTRGKAGRAAAAQALWRPAVFILEMMAARATSGPATGALNVNNSVGAAGAGHATGPGRPMTVLLKEERG